MKHPFDEPDQVTKQAADYAAQVMTWAALALLAFIVLAIFGYWLVMRLTSAG